MRTGRRVLGQEGTRVKVGAGWNLRLNGLIQCNPSWWATPHVQGAVPAMVAFTAPVVKPNDRSERHLLRAGHWSLMIPCQGDRPTAPGREIIRPNNAVAGQGLKTNNPGSGNTEDHLSPTVTPAQPCRCQQHVKLIWPSWV